VRRDTRRYIGVDVGGTKLLALAVTSQGKALGRHKEATRQDGTPLAEQASAAIEGALSDAGLAMDEIEGIGLGVPGVVDSQTGRFLRAPNLVIDDPDLAAGLKQRHGVPVAIGNDVNLGTLAEAWLGAGRGAHTVVGVFVGSGIGGGLVIDGRLRTGPSDLAGEIGHMVLMVDGPECGCGNRGCFEALASRGAIERELRRALARRRSAKTDGLLSGERIKSGALADALRAGDRVVTRVMRRAGHHLAQGVLTIRHLLDPDVIILGGGVIEACGDFLVPIIEDEVRSNPYKGSRDALRIAVSELGDDAVALGAAALVRAHAAEVSVEELELRPSRAAERGRPKAPPGYPRVDEVRFGVAVVEGAEMAYDVYVHADGKVAKRKKKRARKRYGTSHVLDADELAKVCRGDPRTVIIGNGFQGMVRLAEDARQYLETSGADWHVLPTPDAAELYNRAPGPKALFLHVTC
jgi:glucokinase